MGKPFAGAAPEIFTVPVALWPPTSEEGVIAKPDRDGALTISTAAAAVEFRLVEIVDVTSVAVATVPTTKVAVLDPFCTVTDDGRWTAVDGEDKVTVAPPTPAFAVRVMLPLAFVPPKTEPGEIVTFEMP